MDSKLKKWLEIWLWILLNEDHWNFEPWQISTIFDELKLKQPSSFWRVLSSLVSPLFKLYTLVKMEGVIDNLACSGAVDKMRIRLPLDDEYVASFCLWPFAKFEIEFYAWLVFVKTADVPENFKENCKGTAIYTHIAEQERIREELREAEERKKKREEDRKKYKSQREKFREQLNWNWNRWDVPGSEKPKTKPRPEPKQVSAWIDIESPFTKAELKTAYRRACMKHHPDRGGSTEAMQHVNLEYTRLQAYAR